MACIKLNPYLWTEKHSARVIDKCLRLVGKVQLHGPGPRSLRWIQTNNLYMLRTYPFYLGILQKAFV